MIVCRENPGAAPGALNHRENTRVGPTYCRPLKKDTALVHIFFLNFAMAVQKQTKVRALDLESSEATNGSDNRNKSFSFPELRNQKQMGISNCDKRITQ